VYIQTSNLNTIDLLNPDYSGIPLEEFARALSYINRFTGHAGAYSVAQHSVHVAALCPPVHRAAGLLHDLHEAVIGDISTPMKNALGVRDIEARHEKAVVRRFGGVLRCPEVKHADQAMCNAEADQLLGGRIGDGWPNVDPAPIEIPVWSPQQAFNEFMVLAHILDIHQ